MRDSKSKSRKTTNNNSDGDNSGSLQTELELIAVKAKNVDLIKAHTKLVQENSEMRNRIFELQAELVNIQAKYNNLESVFKNLEQNMKRCTPNLIDVLNLFLQVTDSRKNIFSMLNGTDRVSDRGFTPKTKTITHTVKPHTVNGTVLNLVPTISLTRLNPTNTSPRLTEVSSSSPILDYRNSLPSTSTSQNNREYQNENLSPNLDTSEVRNQSFVTRRKNTTSMPEEPLNGSLDLDENDAEPEEHSSDASDQEEENVQRLSTIQEESICSSGRKRTSLGEVRIYLSRLSSEDIHVRRSQNASFTSTEGNANDTCLNIETTVIENPENRVSKRLRADIMVFSPHTNSTRVESDSDSVFSNPSPRDDRGKISIPAVSAIQSTEVTPSTSITNGTEELLTSSRVRWLQTPSMSAMGDRNTSTTKLEILKELGLTPTSSNRSDNTNDMTECSPVSPSVTPHRFTRSSSKIKTRSRSKSNDESRNTLVENQNGGSVKSFINRHRGASGDRPLTPTIVLERLENILPEYEVTASSVNIQILAQTDEPNENENPPRTTESQKSKTKAKRKLPKKSMKRKLTDEEEEGTDTLKEKIREIQIRLSNYMPGSQDDSMDASSDSNKRPQRAARPKTLKDASLKGKLRRMF